MSGSCFLTLRDNTVQNPRCSTAWVRLLLFFYANASFRANPLRCLLELCMNNRCILSVRFDSRSVVLLEGTSCVEELMGSWLYNDLRKAENEEGKTNRRGRLLPAVFPTLAIHIHQ